jgi:hypothetical protein
MPGVEVHDVGNPFCVEDLEFGFFLFFLLVFVFEKRMQRVIPDIAFLSRRRTPIVVAFDNLVDSSVL